MRSSELCTLRWGYIDFGKRITSVKSASVVGVMKGIKIRAGKRKIELGDEAVKALEGQKAFTMDGSEFILCDPKTGMPWACEDAVRKKAWMPTLKRSWIRYRNPYQTRHSFETMHISAGVNLFWLCQQIGDKGPEIFEYDGNT